MGLFAEWVMVRLPASSAAAGDPFDVVGLDMLSERAGWAFAESAGADSDLLVATLVEATGQPALAGWVYDSDFAYVAACAPESQFRLILGEPYTDDEPDDAFRELEQLATPERRAESAKALHSWSERNAPSPISAESSLEILERDWVFAEEGLAELFTQLALPDLDENVFNRRV